ncbi:MAG: DUF167 domain-containing protein [Rickettsiales bacterium]|nr:DUF167 domain-containing protein [Rickettsiales bacterium]
MTSPHTIFYIKVTPNSSQTKISGKFLDEKNQEYIKINLAAVPEDNKANEELIKFLAKTLKISKSKIEIIRGETSRIKVVKVEGDIVNPL